MGSYVLRGITTALLVTVLTLLAGIVWSSMGLGGLSISKLLDIGLLASCLIGGYRTAKESKVWFMGGVAGAGYVTVGTLLLALFLPIRGLGFVQVLAEGALIGLVAGAFAGNNKETAASTWNRQRNKSHFTPSYAGYGKADQGSSDFAWDTEESFTPRAVSSELNWMDGAEEEFPKILEARQDSVVEWPWDREKKHNNEHKNENENLNLDLDLDVDRTASSEPRQARNDLTVWNNVEEKAKPWWEE